jgi:hypothetical protein
MFLAGLAFSFWTLFAFERRVRREQALPPLGVRAALRRLICGGLVSGVGMGLLGLAAFTWGRSGPPPASAYVWAGFFFLAAALGWPAISVAAFMTRVNSLARLFERR